MSEMDYENTMCTDTNVKEVSFPMNYFQELPEEVVLEIFSYFKPRELCQVIVKVCKSWWLLSKQTLWTELSLRPEIQTEISCCDLLQRSSCRLLKSLKLNLMFSSNVWRLVQSVANITHLKELGLKGCHLSSRKSDMFATIVSNCPLIEILILDNCRNLCFDVVCHIVTLKNLNSLTVYDDHIDINDECIKLIARKCEKLSLLNLYNVQSITDSAIYELCEFRRESLQQLNIKADRLTDNAILSISSCKNLNYLQVSYGHNFTDAALDYLLTLPNLTCLMLRYWGNLSSGALSRFFLNKSLAKIKTVELSSLWLTKTGLQNLARTCKNLECLILWNSCKCISYKELKTIIGNFSSLRCLWVDNINVKLNDKLLKGINPCKHFSHNDLLPGFV